MSSSTARQAADPPPARRDPTHLILVAVSLVAVAAIFWLVADALVIAFGGIVLASVLLSLATPLAEATGLKPRWSLLIVVVGLLAVAGLFSWLFGNEVAGEMSLIS